MFSGTALYISRKLDRTTLLTFVFRLFFYGNSSLILFKSALLYLCLKDDLSSTYLNVRRKSPLLANIKPEINIF